MEKSSLLYRLDTRHSFSYLREKKLDGREGRLKLVNRSDWIKGYKALLLVL